MGIFSNILAKIGFGDDKVETAATKPAATAPAATAPAASAPAAAPISAPAAAAAPAIVAMNTVDVVANMEALAKAHPEKLNWKASIVDLMKLLGLDSSLTSRKALATELNCPPEKMSDSAQMNMWLHKTVLQKIAENGGNVPADLL